MTKQKPLPKIESCPFCRKLGAVALGFADLSHTELDWRVVCSNSKCGAQGPIRSNERNAIKAWNIL